MARLEIVQGDTAVLRITVLNPDGTPTNLTGYAITFTIKRSRGDLDQAAIFQGTLAGGDITIVSGNPALGLFDVTVPAAKTKVMRPNKPYYWDAQLSQSGQIFTPCNGTIFADGEITQSTS
jgi:hypothetical protein